MLDTVTWISRLFATLEKSFPLFLRRGLENAVDDSGKLAGKKVFQTGEAFSTSFPQNL